MLLRCTAGSGSAVEGAAVDDSERCKLSVLAVVLGSPASRLQHVAQVSLRLLASTQIKGKALRVPGKRGYVKQQSPDPGCCGLLGLSSTSTALLVPLLARHRWLERS